jgi:hypothetical protein
VSREEWDVLGDSNRAEGRMCHGGLLLLNGHMSGVDSRGQVGARLGVRGPRLAVSGRGVLGSVVERQEAVLVIVDLNAEGRKGKPATTVVG